MRRSRKRRLHPGPFEAIGACPLLLTTEHEEDAYSLIPIYYSPDYTAANDAFDTTRKATWVAASLLSAPIVGVALTAPTPLSSAQLEKVHDPAYVAAVRIGLPRRLAESSGIRWDPNVWQAVRSSNGGAVAAALAALQTRRNAGSLSSGLHHAARDHGAGFSTFNGLALAARAALDDAHSRFAYRRVLIIDLDAHGGGGTYSIIRQWQGVVHLDLAVSPYETYRPQAQSTLDYIRDAADYLPTLKARLAALDDGPGFDVVIYNAGVDPYEGCDIGGLSGMTAAVLAERDRIVFDWAARHTCPVAFVLAGGYVGNRLSQATLVDLPRQTVAAAVPALDPVAQ
jgi:acetoin utilization deacetylase AcuC-like enzyme